MKATTILPLLSLLITLALTAPLPPSIRDSHLEERDIDINRFLAQISLLFPFSGLISDISGLLTIATQSLAFFFGFTTTRNELSGQCKAITVIFARGTTEPGNVGAVAGPPFFDALRRRVGSANLALQGVNDYRADVTGFLLGGSVSGAANMASLVNQALTKCPNTKVVMGGYSQGGQVVHLAADRLPAATMAKVSSVVIFGDPLNRTPVRNAAGKTLVICNVGDLICERTSFIFLPHLTYAGDAPRAADYAVAKAGF